MRIMYADVIEKWMLFTALNKLNHVNGTKLDILYLKAFMTTFTNNAPLARKRMSDELTKYG